MFVCVCCPHCGCGLQLSRKYYSSRQQFLADAQQIHTAASSYHRAGRGQIINIKVPGAAAAMVDEARRVLEEPAIAQLLDYWEGRIKVHRGQTDRQTAQNLCS